MNCERRTEPRNRRDVSFDGACTREAKWSVRLAGLGHEPVCLCTQHMKAQTKLTPYLYEVKLLA